MNWLDRFEAWLQKQAKLLVLRGAIGVCNRIISLTDDIDYIEWSEMAKLAFDVRPKLYKEYRELKDGKHHNYFKG